MKTGIYKFVLIFKDDAFLPEYKGSTFRGVFGHSLKKAVCALNFQECKTCLLNKNCLYSLIFEKHDILGQNHNISSIPHPIVIVPPDTNQKYFKKNEQIEVEVILFGDFNQKLPYFILTFQTMGQTGIGKKIKGRRSKFSLEKIISSGKTIFKNKNITDMDTSFNLSIDKHPYNKTITNESVFIEFKTPLRIKFNKSFPENLTFQTLTRTMLRRISSLMNCYGDGEPALDYKRLVNEAAKINIKESNLYWKDWQRYSNRHHKKMYMGGLMGNITYSGKIREYIPLIEACSKIHLGKNTIFGLGRFKYSII